MALILNIDTATDIASVCFSKDGVIVGSKENTIRKDHAAVMAVFIKALLDENEISPREIDAVAISGGPGSYTGLRVAASTAKGLCFAWNKPLIAINTLKMMANGMRQQLPEAAALCPAIDARRMEVFTALYDNQLNVLKEPAAVIVKENFMQEFEFESIEIFGSGAEKICRLPGINPALRLHDFTSHAGFLVSLAEEAFRNKQFEDVAYYNPQYIKAFHYNFTHS